MSLKALKSGDAQPKANPDVLRIYSMRFCPFAERTRLVLHHKEIPHEIVNINLEKKPEWYFELNPFGQVPTLQYKGNVVWESRVCNEFLDNTFPDCGEGRIYPDSPVEKARGDMLVAYWEAKVQPPFYKMMTPGKLEEGRDEFQSGMAKIEEKLGQRKFFGGEKPNFVDYMIYPWFERLGMMESLLKGANIFPADKFPVLTSWKSRMEALPAVSKSMLPLEMHKAFAESYMRQAIDYDVGLPA